MDRFSNKETLKNMFRGFFKVVPIGIIALIIWALLALFGFDVDLDYDSAKFMAIGFPVLLVIYWLLFKYYDKNNP